MPIAPGASPQQQEARIGELVAKLSLDEKVFMLSGHGFFDQVKDSRYCASAYHIAAGNERLGVPPLLFLDGPRGVDMGESTCFPVSMARGASFDTDLERRVGDAIGRELRAHGANLFGGVCINLLRHPAWGRAQETYGEDPFLLGEMGVALTRGVQHHNVVATPKHYACNSMENARFTVDVVADERTLREVYLPHFKRCIDAGAGAVMSAYNQVNGAYCGHNPQLLTSILKDDWGFDGFVYSDFILGCRGPDASAAGLDVEAPDTIHFGPKLIAAVEAGEVAVERIDDAVARVLRSLFRTLATPDPETYRSDQIACAEHVALAREAAEKSIVVLRNEAALPLGADVRKLLVVGPLATVENLGDHGSSRVFPPSVVTPLAGVRTGAGPNCKVSYDSGKELVRLRALAAEADAVLVVAGYTHVDEGEYIPEQLGSMGSVGGDRSDLTLGAEQEAMIRAATDSNPRTIVAIMSGSAVIVDAWAERAAGILMLWYPGMEGGTALADVVFGRVNPSGRLPFSVPKRAEDLPFFDRDAKEITYDLWHGYTHLQRRGIEPAYPFGYGLSYSEFSVGTPDVSIATADASIAVDVVVSNASGPAGEAVVQVYAGLAEPREDQPLKRLCGFARVALAEGANQTVRVPVALRDIASFDPAARHWRIGGAWKIWAGTSSADADLTAVTIDIPERTWSTSE